MDYLEYLYSLRKAGMKLGLERMEALIEALGRPDKDVKIVHVAGTNGKGSTSAFISSILHQAGYKVGLHMSPHLVKVNERFKINGIDIGDERLEELVWEVKKIIEEKNLEVSFFEFITGLALLYFSKENVDYAVLEVGLGGRLDATNVVTPEVAVITNVSFDHTKILGESLEEISFEKAGIVKKGIPTVLGEKNGVVEKICLEEESKLFIAEPFLGEIGLLGEHQKKNAGVAAKVAELLSIGRDAIEEGLRNVEWKGRIQWVKEDFLVDGAHNVAGMKTFVEYLKNVEGKKILLTGFSEGKDYRKMLELLMPLFEKIVVTKGSFKPVDPFLVAEGFDVEVVEDLEDALVKVETFDGLKVCVGSLYLVGDVLKLLE